MWAVALLAAAAGARAARHALVGGCDSAVMPIVELGLELARQCSCDAGGSPAGACCCALDALGARLAGARKGRSPARDVPPAARAAVAKGWCLCQAAHDAQTDSCALLDCVAPVIEAASPRLAGAVTDAYAEARKVVKARLAAAEAHADDESSSSSSSSSTYTVGLHDDDDDDDSSSSSSSSTVSDPFAPSSSSRDSSLDLNNIGRVYTDDDDDDDVLGSSSDDDDSSSSHSTQHVHRKFDEEEEEALDAVN